MSTMTANRDFQKQKVYDAENLLGTLFDHTLEHDNPMIELFGMQMTLPPEGRFASLDSIDAYLKRVCAQIGAIPPTVRERKGQHIAHYCNGEIAIPMQRAGKWALRELVILHELAHHLARGDQHGPRFVGKFIELLTAILGPEAGLAMRLICADTGVKEG